MTRALRQYRRRAWRASTALAVCFAITVAGRELRAASIVDVSVAGLYVDQQITVEAPVTATSRDGNVVRLRLGTAPHHVDVSLVEGLLSNFPAHAEQYYAGKNIRVGGMLREFRGNLEITVQNAAQIQVIEAGQGLEPRPSAPPVLDQQRLRQLEQRIQQLEVSPAPTAAAAAVAPSPTATTFSAAPSPRPTETVIVAPSPAAPVSDSDDATRALNERLRKMELRMRLLERELQKRH